MRSSAQDPPREVRVFTNRLGRLEAADTSAASRSPDQPNRINFGWLLRLRWWMIAGQLLVILGVRVTLGLELPLLQLLAIVAAETGLNLAGILLRRRHEPREWWLMSIMACDIVLFTGLLYFTGGPSNPFSFLYLVQIALAAITVRAAWSWALTGLALLGSATLFLVPSHLKGGLSHADYMNFHLRGMWVAFGVAAGFIAHFLFRVRRALEHRESELHESRRAAARQDRLASLATLAAGAAHELSTPLATIAVAVKELEWEESRRPIGGDRRHDLGSTSSSDRLIDIRLIREQVDRCRAILERMSSEAGQTIGESLEPIELSDLVGRALAGLAPGLAVRSQIPEAERGLRLWLPPRGMAQALRGLVKNAQEASPQGGEVAISVGTSEDSVEIAIEDLGCGISPAMMDRIGEPFFTTKPVGRGMGLGVFLARAVVERLGGEITFESELGRGTTVTIKLPTSRPPRRVVAS